MKKLFYIFCIGYLFNSCMAEQDNPLVNMATCFDRIRNQNEEEIDCGGTCKACIVEIPIDVPCKSSLTNNSMNLDSRDFTFTDQNFSSTQYADTYEIFFWNGTTEIIIYIYGNSLPTKPTKYNLTYWFDLEPGTASIKVTEFYNYQSTQGDLYVSYENGYWVVEFCSVNLIGQESSTMNSSGRIICK